MLHLEFREPGPRGGGPPSGSQRLETPITSPQKLSKIGVSMDQNCKVFVSKNERFINWW